MLEGQQNQANSGKGFQIGWVKCLESLPLDCRALVRLLVPETDAALHVLSSPFLLLIKISILSLVLACLQSPCLISTC